VLRRHYGKEADIWSCGVILYILLCGVPPFWGETEQQIFDAILKGRLDFQSDPWPAISAEAKECVRAMLQPVRPPRCFGPLPAALARACRRHALGAEGARCTCAAVQRGCGPGSAQP